MNEKNHSPTPFFPRRSYCGGYSSPASVHRIDVAWLPLVLLSFPCPVGIWHLDQLCGSESNPSPEGQRHPCHASQTIFFGGPPPTLGCSDSRRRSVFCVLITFQGHLFFPFKCPMWSGSGDLSALGHMAHSTCGAYEHSHTLCWTMMGELCTGWGTSPSLATGHG